MLCPILLYSLLWTHGLVFLLSSRSADRVSICCAYCTVAIYGAFGVQVGRYRTPGGADIDRTGILPDFRSPPSPEVAAARLRACVPPPRV